MDLITGAIRGNGGNNILTKRWAELTTRSTLTFYYKHYLWAPSLHPLTLLLSIIRASNRVDLNTNIRRIYNVHATVFARTVVLDRTYDQHSSMLFSSIAIPSHLSLRCAMARYYICSNVFINFCNMLTLPCDLSTANSIYLIHFWRQQQTVVTVVASHHAQVPPSTISH